MNRFPSILLAAGFLATASASPALASHCQQEIDAVNAALADEGLMSGVAEYTKDEVRDHLALAQERCDAGDDAGAVSQTDIANLLLGLE